MRSDAAALGVSHLLPGGAATSVALRYRLLQQGGAPAGDAAAGVSVLAVVSWRLFEFWAPIPIGGLSYLSLRVQRWREGRRPQRSASAARPTP